VSPPPVLDLGLSLAAFRPAGSPPPPFPLAAFPLAAFAPGITTGSTTGTTPGITTGITTGGPQAVSTGSAPASRT
jgi:hypothetical protein